MSAKVRSYKSPEALRHAIEHHLRSISPIEKKDVLRLRKHLAFERFLARMFDEKTCPMVLTGGYAMELRMDHARATKDIDLVLSSRKISRLDADEMHATVHDFLSYVALKDLGDFFSFEIREGKSELAGPPYGGFRFHIEATLDNRQFAKFHIDIGASRVTVAPIENLTSKNLLSFAGVECPPFPSVPVEYQLADKLHAYTFVRKGKRSTRVKDLIDMVLIIQDKELELKKSQLRRLFVTLSSSLHKQLKEEHNISKNGFLGQVNEAINCIRRKDFVALKSIYKRLFEKIVVHPLENARVELEFVVRNLSTPQYNYTVGNCLSVPRMEFEHQETNFLLNPKILIKSTTCITYSLIPEALLIQKYLENRLSIGDIARELACSKTYVRSLLQKYNIPRRQSSDYRGSRWYAYGKRKVNGKTVEHKGEQRTIAAIKRMYAEGMNTLAIARCLNTMKIPTKRLERESDRQVSMNEVNGKGWHYCTVATILKREGVYVVGRKKEGRHRPSCGLATFRLLGTPQACGNSHQGQRVRLASLGALLCSATPFGVF